MKTLNVVGCGKVGQALARLLHLGGVCAVQDVVGRRQEQAEAAVAFVGAGRAVAGFADLRPADLWLLGLPDTRIGEVAGQLAAALPLPAQPPVAFHCSGFHAAAVMAPLAAQGFGLASVHPVRAFADPAIAVAQFEGTPCGLEGDAAALQVLRPLFEAIGGRCFEVATERKPLYHAAAVFCSNFTVVLQAVAREAWAEAGVPDALATTVQSALLDATVANWQALGPRAVTGPAARGDADVVSRQGAEVARWHPEAGRLYAQLSVLARRLAVAQATLPDQKASSG